MIECSGNRDRSHAFEGGGRQERSYVSKGEDCSQCEVMDSAVQTIHSLLILSSASHFVTRYSVAQLARRRITWDDKGRRAGQDLGGEAGGHRSQAEARGERRSHAREMPVREMRSRGGKREAGVEARDEMRWQQDTGAGHESPGERRVSRDGSL